MVAGIAGDANGGRIALGRAMKKRRARDRGGKCNMTQKRADELRSDRRLSYWLKGLDAQNFGDLLSELLLEAFHQPRWLRPARLAPVGSFDVVHMLGSVISAGHIIRGLEYARANPQQVIAFWGCGLRDEAPIAPHLRRHCAFFGIRGPSSRAVLGLPDDTPCADPGLLIPVLHEPPPPPPGDKQAICVPHFLEKRDDSDLLRQTGVDRIVRPNIAARRAALCGMIDTIAHADFVMAGALHAAIVAAAYGVPFAYYDSGYIDVPFKWRDFAESVGIPAVFSKSLPEAREVFARDIRSAMRLPPLAPLVRAAPYRAPASLLRRTKQFDLRNKKMHTGPR